MTPWKIESQTATNDAHDEAHGEHEHRQVAGLGEVGQVTFRSSEIASAMNRRIRFT